MGDVRVEPVSDQAGLMDFIRFPFQLYAADPTWVPPFVEERRDFFDPRKNPFFEHARSRLFLARRNGQLVGTVGAVVDDRHNEVHGERMGAFGFFEAIDDPEAAGALLRAAEDWARGQGMTIMRGPLNFSTNQECGLLVEGFDEPPMMMMTYNPVYYRGLIEAAGYHKAMDLYAYIADLDDRLRHAPPKAFRAAERAAHKHGIRIRRVDMRQFDRDVRLARQVYNDAWTLNWGFVPMTDAEFDHLAHSLKPFLDPNLLFIAEAADGTPIGVSVAVPDLNQPLLWGGGGRMFPLGLLKFLWHKRKVNQVRLIIMGVAAAYRGLGIDALFYVETARAAVARGYHRLEASWLLESNVMMNRIVERLGGQRYKTYRIYERSLA